MGGAAMCNLHHYASLPRSQTDAAAVTALLRGVLPTLPSGATVRATASNVNLKPGRQTCRRLKGPVSRHVRLSSTPSGTHCAAPRGFGTQIKGRLALRHCQADQNPSADARPGARRAGGAGVQLPQRQAQLVVHRLRVRRLDRRHARPGHRHPGKNPTHGRIAALKGILTLI